MQGKEGVHSIAFDAAHKLDVRRLRADRRRAQRAHIVPVFGGGQPRRRLVRRREGRHQQEGVGAGRLPRGVQQPQVPVMQRVEASAQHCNLFHTLI